MGLVKKGWGKDDGHESKGIGKGVGGRELENEVPTFLVSATSRCEGRL